MKITELVIIGAGMGYHEVKDIINDINDIKPTYKIISILDDNERMIGQKIDDIEVKGPIESAKYFDETTKFVFAIGSHQTRLSRIEIIKKLNLNLNRFATIIHPTVRLSPSATVSNGCIINCGCVIFNNCTIEPFCVFEPYCIIGYESYTELGCLFASNAIILTQSRIGTGSFIGSGARINEFVNIGAGSFIGLGSVVIKDVKANQKVFGNPALPI